MPDPRCRGGHVRAISGWAALVLALALAALAGSPERASATPAATCPKEGAAPFTFGELKRVLRLAQVTDVKEQRCWSPSEVAILQGVARERPKIRSSPVADVLCILEPYPLSWRPDSTRAVEIRRLPASSAYTGFRVLYENVVCSVITTRATSDVTTRLAGALRAR